MHFKNKTALFDYLISSNYLRNFTVKFQHLLRNTRVDLENGVAYITKRVE